MTSFQHATLPSESRTHALVPSVSYTGRRAGNDIRVILKASGPAFGNKEREQRSSNFDEVATWCGKLCIQSMITFQNAPVDSYAYYTNNDYKMFFTRLQSTEMIPSNEGYEEKAFYIAAAVNLSNEYYGRRRFLVDRFSRFVEQYQAASAMFEEVTTSGFGLRFDFGKGKSTALQRSEPEALGKDTSTDQGSQLVKEENF